MAWGKDLECQRRENRILSRRGPQCLGSDTLLLDGDEYFDYFIIETAGLEAMEKKKSPLAVN